MGKRNRGKPKQRKTKIGVNQNRGKPSYGKTKIGENKNRGNKKWTKLKEDNTEIGEI